MDSKPTEPAVPKPKTRFKPMRIKKADFSRTPSLIAELTKSDAPASSSQTPSQTSPAASQEQRGGRSSLNDLDIWGRAKDVHASMQKVEEEKRQKDLQTRRAARSAQEAEKKKRRHSPIRGGKRRKSNEETAIILSDDGGGDNDQDDQDYRPHKSPTATLDTVTPRTSVEPIEPSDIDKILEKFKKKKAEVETAVHVPEPIPLTSERSASTDPSDLSKEIIVQILIISSIEGTKPKVFTRKFGQTLGKVRDTWARLQGFSEEQIERLVLVWQNETRVFDSTLPRSLGIRFDRQGKMYLANKVKNPIGRSDQDEQEAIKKGISPGECKIFFDAMWDDVYEEMMRQKEAAKEKAAAIELSSDGFEEEVVTGIALNSQSMEITLKGKHFEELKLKVKPNMTVLQVIGMIRDERHVDEDTEIELHFDGEQLDEDTTLEDAEIEDEFQIDVVLR